MVLIIIQARMGSTRLPGKVLREVDDGMTVLDLMIKRIGICSLPFVIATTTEEKDNPIVEFLHQKSLPVFRGSESDVLARFYNCALSNGARTIVRLTSDCPLVDAKLISNMMNHFIANKLDYLGNTTPPEMSCYPDGSDIEIFSFQALKRAHEEEIDAKRREHVTFQFWQEDDYVSATFPNDEDWSFFRYTVDQPEDLELVRILWQQLVRNNPWITTREIVTFISQNDYLTKINKRFRPGDNW